jgi:hypothetical protein
MIVILFLPGLGYGDGQHAILPAALNVPVFEIAFEFERAGEPAGRPLAQVGRACIALAQLALAFDGKDFSFYQDLNLRGADAGQVHLDNKDVVVFADIDGRIPPHGAPGPMDQLVENGVNLMMTETQAPPFHHAVPPMDLDSAIPVI